MEYVRGTDQLAGMEGWSEEKWWCGRAGGAAWVGGMGDQLSLSPAATTSPEAAQTVAEDGTFDSE